MAVRSRSGILIALIALAAAGCVERKVTIRTVPPDAEVFVDGQHIGRSPLTLPFTEYGIREVILRKPGYRITRRLVEMQEPYFQQLPLDLYYEVLTSDLYTDFREYQFVLEPNTEEDLSREVVDRTLERAKEIRGR